MDGLESGLVHQFVLTGEQPEELGGAGAFERYKDRVELPDDVLQLIYHCFDGIEAVNPGNSCLRCENLNYHGVTYYGADKADDIKKALMKWAQIYGYPRILDLLLLIEKMQAQELGLLHLGI